MTDVYICDAIRTPVGRYGGGLAPVRADDLAALPIRALLERNPGLDPEAVDDVILGCANQSGEDNRNVARMALLLAGLPASVPGVTVNRLCSSGLNAIAAAANAIQAGEGELMIAGNASGINDGAAALLVASAAAVKAHGLEPLARVVGTAYAGVPPRTMGYGPVPATQKLLLRLGLGLDEFDVVELNEAFAAQALTCLRELGLADDDPRVNPRGGAIALGHPLGMSGARLAVTAIDQLHKSGGKRALCTMCVGVGQGIATVLERA